MITTPKIQPAKKLGIPPASCNKLITSRQIKTEPTLDNNLSINISNQKWWFEAQEGSNALLAKDSKTAERVTMTKKSLGHNSHKSAKRHKGGKSIKNILYTELSNLCTKQTIQTENLMHGSETFSIMFYDNVYILLCVYSSIFM